MQKYHFFYLNTIKFSYNYLLTGNSRVSIGRSSKHEIVQHGGVGSDTNATANHHSDLELVPILIATTERSFYSYFRVLVFRVIITGIEVIAQFPSPRSLRLNVTREKVLVWRRSQGERMKFVRPKCGTRKTNPLTG